MESTTIKCPNCQRNVFADIYETDTETNKPTESGFLIHCSEDVFEKRCDWLYEDYLLLNEKVYKYFKNKAKII